MTDETEKKLLNAALNVFAKKGRDAATTKAIAEKAGRTEMTLFRKFGTKKNLFDLVLFQNMEKIREGTESIVKDLDNKLDDPGEFLETYTRRMLIFYRENIDAFALIVNDDNAAIDPLLGDINNYIGEFIGRNIPTNNLNPKTLGIFINSFIYSLTMEVYHGKDSNIDYDEKVETFIKNLKFCFE